MRASLSATHHAFADPIGERTFGMRAGRDGIPGQPDGAWCDLQLAWFGAHLGGDGDIELPEAPVRIFVMGRNEWRDVSSWPPEHVTIERWFVHSDRSLSTRSPETDESPSAFTYDPANPAPTMGGNGVTSSGYAAGPINQTPLEARDDVLVFTSDPLRDDVEVRGRVRVMLHAQSSAPSTDWVARLCDVHPDGRSFNICDGIVRVAERAHECARYEIDLWSTSNVFLRGHRIRIHVTSSSFPRWDRNLNTGNQRDSRHQAAQQRVHHARERPSYIELPTVGPQGR
jgi:putative CocE/NonD family hydrolase